MWFMDEMLTAVIKCIKRANKKCMNTAKKCRIKKENMVYSEKTNKSGDNHERRTLDGNQEREKKRLILQSYCR